MTTKNDMITGLYLMLSKIIWIVWILFVSNGLEIVVNDWHRFIWWGGGLFSLWVIRPVNDWIVALFTLIMGPIVATTIGFVHLHAKILRRKNDKITQ